MIIAEIGMSKFVLNDIKSAETLLRILAEAKQVNDTYIRSECKTVIYEDTRRVDINISIRSNADILSYRDAMDLKESYENRADDD
jgi:hypothetical protein